MSNGLTELPLSTSQTSELWSTYNLGIYGGPYDPSDPNYNPLSTSEYNATPDLAGMASGSLWKNITNAAASIGATVSNVLNAQKYGYNLTPTAAPQGVGTAAVPVSQQAAAGVKSTVTVDSRTLFLIALGGLGVWLVVKKRF